MVIRKDVIESSLKRHLITARTDKWIACILKVLHSEGKKTICRMRRYLAGREKVFVNYIYARELIFRQYNELKMCIHSISKQMNWTVFSKDKISIAKIMMEKIPSV